VSNLALYELAREYQQLNELVEPDIPAELIRDVLDGIQGQIEVKAANVAKFIRNLEASAEAIEEAASALKKRAQARRNRADSIRAYLLMNMQATGVTRIEAPEFTLAIRKNPEAVVISELAVIPESYMVQPEPPPPRPDKKALKEAIKAGAHVEGVWLQSGERLEIRT
jgi:hypothetical protein